MTRIGTRIDRQAFIPGRSVTIAYRTDGRDRVPNPPETLPEFGRLAAIRRAGNFEWPFFGDENRMKTKAAAVGTVLAGPRFIIRHPGLFYPGRFDYVYDLFVETNAHNDNSSGLQERPYPVLPA